MKAEVVHNITGQYAHTTKKIIMLIINLGNKKDIR